jgi:uncharacterized protein with NAD-binding domain and iron-sulfur cluster
VRGTPDDGPPESAGTARAGAARDLHCVVLGGGLSGLAAALDLARRGRRVTLLEAGPVLGGRTASWTLPASTYTDTGLHVVADHYQEFLTLIESLGLERRVRWWHEHPCVRATGERFRLRLSPLPPPLHLLYPAVALPASFRARRRLASAAWAVARMTQQQLESVDDLSYLQWHRSFRLDDGLLLEMAELAADATTFLPLDRVSARALLSWIKYMFRHRHAARIGTLRGPIGDVLIEPLGKAVSEAGGHVRRAVGAVGLVASGDRVSGVVARRSRAVGPCYAADGGFDGDGPCETIAADAVISALPVQALRSVLDPALAQRAGLHRALMLQTVPAISVILAFDRPLAPIPSAAVLATGAVFRNCADLTALWNREGPSLLQCLIGDAERRWAWPDGEIVQAALGDLRNVHPATIDAEIASARVERVPAAMFAATPGSHALRPPAHTGLRGFYLAGDWTEHPLNASMEGAVFAGLRAARAVLADHDAGRA